MPRHPYFLLNIKPVRESERKREGEKEREREREREREKDIERVACTRKHASASRKYGRALGIPHSAS